MEPKWFVEFASCNNCSKLFEPFNILDYREKSKKFYELSPDEKSNYKGADDYLFKNEGINLTSLNKNYLRLYDEICERLENEEKPERLPIDLIIQKDAIVDLLSSLENENYIKEIYKIKKKKVKGGLNTTEALYLVDCIKQGRSLLLAGSNADMLAKPLVDFYAASAYAYAIIVINSPLHKSINSLKGSHGHTYNHELETIEFGGNLPSGTFLDLLGSLSVIQVCNDRINIKYSLLNSIDFVQQNNIKFSLLSLLSLVPELNEYYIQLDKEHRNVHKLNIDTGVNNSKVTYNFYIGDGTYKPQIEKLKKDFNTTDILENQGAYLIKIPAEQIHNIMPCIYKDLFGQFWYIESPIEGFVLPELCLHFLIISALCNIMRYSPHEWSNILSNKISSTYSLLISKYLRLFELKFPMLASEMITNFTPCLNNKQ